jgi:capsular polysaccharide biosynthesis protein
MGLRYFLKIVHKRIWIVLLIPLISTIATAFISFFILQPQYEASATIYVTSNNYKSATPMAIEDIMISQQLIKDYRELIKSRSITKVVLEQLSITELSPGDLAKMITANLKNETRILEIKVTDTDAIRAKTLVDKLSTVFIDKIKALMKVENIDIIDSAEIPEAPIKPRHFVNIVIAFIMSTFLSISIVLITDYMDDNIKTEEDVEKYLELTVLGTIPVSNIK